MISWFVFPASSRFIGILVLGVGTIVAVILTVWEKLALHQAGLITWKTFIYRSLLDITVIGVTLVAAIRVGRWVGTFALNQVLQRQPDLGHGMQVSLLLVIGFTVGFGVSNLIQLLKGRLVGV